MPINLVSEKKLSSIIPDKQRASLIRRLEKKAQMLLMALQLKKLHSHAERKGRRMEWRFNHLLQAEAGYPISYTK